MKGPTIRQNKSDLNARVADLEKIVEDLQNIRSGEDVYNSNVTSVTERVEGPSASDIINRIGFFNTRTSAPTFSPSGFIDQILWNTGDSKLYFGDKKNGVWRSVGGGSAKTVTFVVGPESNSDSGSYDYTTDGTSDQVQIQQAIDALPTNGGKIILREGTYTISAAIEVNDINISIEGMGIGTKIRPASSGTLNLFEASGAFSRLSNFYIDGSNNTTGTIDGIMASGRNTIIKNVTFIDLRGSAISALTMAEDNSDESLIDGCYFKDWDKIAGGNDYAIEDWTGTVSNCFFTHSNTGASYVYSENRSTFVGNVFYFPASYIGVALFLDTSESVISGNYFYAAGAFGAAIVIQASNRSSITSNRFDGGGVGAAGAVMVQSSSRSAVVGNVFDQVAGTAIELTGSGSVATGNVIDECGRHGIYVYGDNCSVTGNFIRGAGKETNDTYDSIRMEATVGTSDRNVINGNTLTAEGITNKPKYHINEVDGDKNIITSNATNADAVTGQINVVGVNTVNGFNITT
jgi:hypothetical protein